MIENSKRKSSAGEAEKPQVVPAGSPGDSKEGEQLFHFAGSGKYYPLAVWASSEQQAIEIWVKKRIAYEQ